MDVTAIFAIMIIFFPQIKLTDYISFVRAPVCFQSAASRLHECKHP